MKRKCFYIAEILFLYILTGVFVCKESWLQAIYCFGCGATLFWLHYPVITKKKGQ